MTAPLFVLIACLFCLAANSPTALDAAIAMQRSKRIAELRQRATGHNYVAYTLVGAAFLAQIAALATDHFAHASISAVSILPAMAAVSSVKPRSVALLGRS